MLLVCLIQGLWKHLRSREMCLGMDALYYKKHMKNVFPNNLIKSSIKDQRERIEVTVWMKPGMSGTGRVQNQTPEGGLSLGKDSRV